MRLYPPAPLLMRRTIRPVRLDNVELGEGATITIPIYLVHRHRHLWHDPLQFDPARFSPEAKAKRHRCAYMPFGAGPRTCVGSFAMVEGKTILATLLSQARFRAARRRTAHAVRAHHASPQRGLATQRNDASRLVVDVERLGAGRLAVLIERDLLDARLGLAQQRVTMGLQRLAPLVDEDRCFQLDIALLQAIDDGLELLERLLETHGFDVGMVGRFGHGLA
jgi:hypothetical protein